MNKHICIAILLMFMFVAGCGNTDTNSGALTFGVVWQGAPTLASTIRADHSAPHAAMQAVSAPIDCTAAGVSTVSALAYSISNVLLASGGPWNCSAHSGTISNIPAQSNVKIVILGKDSSDSVLYRGEQPGITVTAGQVTSAGTITATYFPPVLSTPTNSTSVIDGAFNFSWSNTGVSYDIQVSNDTSFSSILINDTTAITSYSPVVSLSTGTHYWHVKSHDGYGHVSAWSDVHSFVIVPPVGIPTSVTATAGDQQNTIAWLPVSGATSYNIYWSTASGVNKTNGAQISLITNLSYIHATPPLTNWVTYYYVVTAVNALGESFESQEISAVPHGASGALDTTFNSQGWAVHNNASGVNSNDEGNAITFDSSGRILITGASYTGAGNRGMVIWRYNTNGTLDTTFNNGQGFVVHNSAAGGNGNDVGKAIKLDSSGRILVTGYSLNTAGNSDMVIWRYNTNGTLDTTFNNGQGFVVHNSAAGGNSDDNGYAITVDSSGRILVAGHSNRSAINSDMVIWRYNTNGTLDTTFNNGQGFVVHNSAAGGNSYDSGYAITVDSSDRILVTGRSWNTAGTTDMVIWRYDPNGALDTTFNGQGWLIHNSAAGGNSYDDGYGITIDSSERILVTGYSRNASGNDDMVIWRYNPNGILDRTFVHGNAAGGNRNDDGFGIFLDSSGRILVAGHSVNAANNYDMVIWRFNPVGPLDSLDTTFNGQGWIVHNSAAGGNSNDWGFGITIDSNGRVLVTGYSRNAAGNDDMVIWRYNP